MAAPSPEDFALPSSCRTVSDVRLLLTTTPGQRGLHRRVAAFEMASAAWHARRDDPWYRDGLRVLDALATAKAEIDIAGAHVIEIATLTAAVLHDTQQAVHDATIPATEWLTAHEVVDIAVARALHHAHTQDQRRG